MRTVNCVSMACICCSELMTVLAAPLHSKCEARHYYGHMQGLNAEQCDNPTLYPTKINTERYEIRA